MHARLRHPSVSLTRCVCDEATAEKIDPTGTGALRRKYRSIAAANWMKLTAALRALVIDQDFFGLAPAKGRDLTLRIIVPPEARVEAFDGWISGILNKLADPSSFKVDELVKESYVQATKRAMRLSEKNVVSFGLMGPLASNLRSQATLELRGIVEALRQNLLRKIAFSNGALKPASLYKELSDSVRVIGVNRVNTLINVLAVKAHALATLDQFELAGIKDVGILPEYVVRDAINDAAKKKSKPYGGPGSRLKPGQKPSKSTLARMRKAQKRLERFERVEVITAGDDDVCERCEEIAEGSPYSINEARSLIPAHPNCRCAFIPVEVVYGDGGSK